MAERELSCDACGTPLRESAFENGRAFVILKKRLCAKCFEKLPGNVDVLGAPVPSGEDRPAPVASPPKPVKTPTGATSAHSDRPDGPTASQVAAAAAEADRRTGPRFVPPREAELSIKSRGLGALLGDMVVEWLEVSEGGLRAIVSRRLSVDDEVNGRIRCRNLEFPMSLTVRYVRQSVKMPKCHVVGFKFHDTSVEFRGFVRDKLCKTPMAGWQPREGGGSNLPPADPS